MSDNVRNQTPCLVFFVGIMIIFLMILFLFNMAEGACDCEWYVGRADFYTWDYGTGDIIKRIRYDWTSGMAMTKRFEGFRGRIYQCSAGVNSIGYGFNLAEPFITGLIPAEVRSGSRALTKREADEIFPVVYEQSVKDAKRFLGEDVFNNLNISQQDIIVDMAYNLGLARLSEFKNMKAALVSGDYARAAREMKNSLWYRQTGNRGKHHVSSFNK